jgi:hypothetical protein
MAKTGPDPPVKRTRSQFATDALALPDGGTVSELKADTPRATCPLARHVICADNVVHPARGKFDF